MASPAPLVLVGGGGHCRSLIDIIEQAGRFAIAGYLDRPERRGSSLFGYPWLGSDDDLPFIARDHRLFAVAVGQIGLPSARESLFEKILAAGGALPVVASPFAVVSPRAVLGDGTAVFHGAIVNAGASIGRNVIINSAALIEHDAAIGDHSHISTGARVNGGVRVGARSFVGSGAVIKEGLHLAEGAILGAGSVLLQNTEPYSVYAGVPARLIKSAR